MALGIMFNYQVPVQAGIVAHPGGGQTSATPLLGMFNSVDTVGTGADSVILPAAIPGIFVFVLNNQASNAIQVFGVAANAANANVGDTIAPYGTSTYAATGTGVSQAASTLMLYVCTALGQWKQGALS